MSTTFFRAVLSQLFRGRSFPGLSGAARPQDVPEHTLVVITTDGMENASRRYSLPQVKRMIQRQKERYGGNSSLC